MKNELILRYLRNHGIEPDEYEDTGDGRIYIQINWGDWKHEHAYCTYLMEQLGFLDGGEDETEEDGSDCYSARHCYLYSYAVSVVHCKDCVYCKTFYHGNNKFSSTCLWWLRELTDRNGSCDHGKER